MIWLELNLWWEAREKSKPDDGRKFALFVNTLPDFDPIYQSWRLPSDPPREALHLPMSEAEAKQLLKEHIPRNASGKVFWMLGSSIWGMHAGPPPYDLRRSSDAATLCSIGAYSYRNSPLPNHIRMSLTPKRPSTGHPWRASELRPLMKFAREVWNPGEMYTMLSSYKLDLPKIDASPQVKNPWYLKPRIGWITYLPPDLAIRAKYPVDVEVETLVDGAALVTLCEEPFEMTDAEGMARLHALEAALRPIQS